MLEHRWSPRIATHLKVRLKVGRRDCASATIRNINRHGLFVETRARLEPGTAVSVEFEHPDEDAAETAVLNALIMHCNDGGMGLMINIREPAARTLLQKLTTQSWTPHTAGLFSRVAVEPRQPSRRGA